MSNNPTYGQYLIGIDFNPDGREDVRECKQRFADAIDQLYSIYGGEEVVNSKHRLLIDEAITRILDAQMWAVKALTAK